MSYQGKNYNEQGGEKMVVGGTLEIGAAGVVDVLAGGQIKAAGTQASHIADASEAHDLNATFSDTEAETALNSLGAKVNAILAALEGVGIVASS